MEQMHVVSYVHNKFYRLHTSRDEKGINANTDVKQLAI